MKTKSIIGKTILATLVLLVITMPFMRSASATIFFHNIPPATVYMSPTRVVGNMGDTVIVHVAISDVTNLFAFQVGIRFDPSMVSTTAGSIQEGGFLSNQGTDALLSFPGTVDNTNGIVNVYGWTLNDPSLAKNGSGYLMNATFTLKAAGFSDLHIDGIKVTDNAGQDLEVKTMDFFTSVVDGNQYIVQVVGDAFGGTGPPDAGYYNASFNLVTKSSGGTTYKGELNLTVVSFGVRLPDQTKDFSGFANITIPKSLMSCDTQAQWMIFLDNTLDAGRLVNENTTHTSIYTEFVYNEATFQDLFTVQSVHAVPEFSTIFLATLLVLATFAAAMLGKSSWTARRKS